MFCGVLVKGAQDERVVQFIVCFRDPGLEFYLLAFDALEVSVQGSFLGFEEEEGDGCHWTFEQVAERRDPPLEWLP